VIIKLSLSPTVAEIRRRSFAGCSRRSSAEYYRNARGTLYRRQLILFFSGSEPFRLAMSLLRRLVGLGGMLKSLSGVFVPGLMPFLVVVRRGNSVGVCGDIVKLRGSSV
jgi:hypothetical protein